MFQTDKISLLKSKVSRDSYNEDRIDGGWGGFFLSALGQ